MISNNGLAKSVERKIKNNSTFKKAKFFKPDI